MNLLDDLYLLELLIHFVRMGFLLVVWEELSLYLLHVFVKLVVLGFVVKPWVKIEWWLVVSASLLSPSELEFVLLGFVLYVPNAMIPLVEHEPYVLFPPNESELLRLCDTYHRTLSVSGLLCDRFHLTPWVLGLPVDGYLVFEFDQ